MDYKRLFCIVVLLLPLFVKGQEFVVESFENVPTDLTAKTNSRIDNNGRKCGLIKVYVNDVITGTGGPVIDIVDDRGMEKWVYVAHDTKKIQLLFKNHMPLDIVFDDFNYPTITGQMTYLLKLKERNNLSVKTEKEKENVIFRVTPKDAILTVDQQIYPIDDEIAIVSLTPGEHNYRVFAQGYKEQSDKFIVSRDQDNKFIIKLVPIVDSKPYTENNPFITTPQSQRHNNIGSFGSNSKEKRPFANNSLVKKNDFYIEFGLGFEAREDGEGGFIPLTLPIAIGGHIHNFNIEAYFSLMNIIDKEYDSSYGYFSIPQYSTGFKLGYGFLSGNRFKITPQIGFRYIFAEYYGSSYSDSDNYGNITIGLRTYWALSKRAGISITPEYGFAGGFDMKAAFALTF